jgi:transcriptional regulator with XRE-family HTH domain
MRFKRAHMLALGVRIRSLREGRHWSLDRLSKNAGVSAAAIQKIEAGTSNPSLVTIVAIIDALGASVDRLISDVRQLDQGVTVVRNLLQTKAGTSVSLSSTRADRRLDCRVIAMSARQRPVETVRGKPLFGYVLDGGLRLNLSDGEAVELGTGDAFHAGAETSPDWSNPLARRSIVLCINDANGPKNALPRRLKR